MDNDDALRGRIFTRRDVLALMGAAGLVTAAGCGTASMAIDANPDPASLFPGLPGIPQGAADIAGGKRVSIAADNAVNGADAASRAATHTTVAGTALEMEPLAAGAVAWALYSWGTFAAADTPAQLVTDITSGSAAQFWLLLSNYASGRWEVRGPFTSGAQTLAYTNAVNYISPAGNTYAAVVVVSGHAVTVNGLNLKAVTVPDVIATPELTEGPFFEDERLERSDLTGGTLRAAVANGAPFALQVVVYEMDGAAVTPLPGVQVDVWHCDALGIYSDEPAGMQQEDTQGQTWLRGYQMTDSNGQVAFTTVYPGWYISRATHIHFKIRKFNGAATTREFTSQMFFDDALSNAVQASAPYTGSAGRVQNSADSIYMEVQSGEAVGPKLLLDVQPDGSGGYTARFVVGLDFS